MRVRPLLLVLALLLVGSSACASTMERVDEARSSSQQLTETARFCLTLARAVAAHEAGSPGTAADAAEELLVQAPPEVRDDARIVAEALRRAQDGDTDALNDPALHDTLERLQETARELCDPTS